MNLKSLLYFSIVVCPFFSCVVEGNNAIPASNSQQAFVPVRYEDLVEELKPEDRNPEMWARVERVMRMSPYTSDAYTLGRLSQESHAIFMATVSLPHEELDFDSEYPPLDSNTRSIVVVLQPKVHLLRQMGGDNSITAIYSIGGRRAPTEGDRYLVFLSYRKMQRAEAMVLGYHEGVTGLIHIDTDEEADIIEVARGYIRHLRGKEFNSEAYFIFLHNLLDHPVERVRNDAKMDLLRQVDAYDVEQLTAVENDDNINEDIRWYAGYHRKWKTGEYQHPPPPEPSTEVVRSYRYLMQSKVREDMLEGMLILNLYRHWSRANPDQWVDVALPLLEHPDLLVRLSIAQRLTIVGHPASVPVIIEDGLQHVEMPSRSVSHGMLQQMLGEEIEFDPRAPEEERNEQIEAFKQWWEENKHRYEYE